MDDANHVRLFHHYLPQRTGIVLGRVQYRGDDNTGLRNGVGPPYRYAEIQARRACAGSGFRDGIDTRAGYFRIRGDDKRCGR